MSNVTEKTIADRLDEMGPEEKVSFLIMEIDHLSRQQEILNAALARLAPPKLRNELPEIATVVDSPWRCKCGTLLGVYDAETDEMLFRSERFHVIVSVGVGGYLIRSCHKCGRIARQDYVEELPSAGG